MLIKKAFIITFFKGYILDRGTGENVYIVIVF